jgi:hypothetical protein
LKEGLGKSPYGRYTARASEAFAGALAFPDRDEENRLLLDIQFGFKRKRARLRGFSRGSWKFLSETAGATLEA